MDSVQLAILTQYSGSLTRNTLDDEADIHCILSSSSSDKFSVLDPWPACYSHPCFWVTDPDTLWMRKLIYLVYQALCRVMKQCAGPLGQPAVPDETQYTCIKPPSSDVSSCWTPWPSLQFLMKLTYTVYQARRLTTYQRAGPLGQPAFLSGLLGH